MKIQSITQAYSIHPECLFTVKERHSDMSCKRIECETRQVSTDKQCSFYIGYNFEDREIFCYLMDSVNVHFDPQVL